ncbi:MAG: hypothetical protein AB7E34_01005 [Acidaminococcaceae bacterium]
MKIKKNLSDADMMKGFKEEKSFETEILGNSKVDSFSRRTNKAVKNNKELLLPAEAQEKLNKYLLELSMEWFKNGNGEVEWKVQKEKDQIIIKPAPSKRKAVQ